MYEKLLLKNGDALNDFHINHIQEGIGKIDKDLDLLKKIHSITTVRRVYDAKQNSSESVVEYFNEIKDFVTSERYQNINEVGKRYFESHVLEILKGIVIKGIGTEYFATKTIRYLSKPNVNVALD